MSLPKKLPPRAPLTELVILQREVNQLFERLAELDRADQPAAGEWLPSIDIFECHGALNVVAEVPGLSPDSLRVAYRDGCLVVSGERRERKATPGAAFLCLERPQGRFRRTIPLDIPVDVPKAEATLSGGLLTVVLPRVKDRRGRETPIPIKREGGEGE
jgi:HSP20 family protein